MLHLTEFPELSVRLLSVNFESEIDIIVFYISRKIGYHEIVSHSVSQIHLFQLMEHVGCERVHE